MGFWTSQRIRAENDGFKTKSPYSHKDKKIGIVSNFSDENIDCNAYTLKIGAEYYVSPIAGSEDPHTHSLKTLDDGEAFQIPPGQFAFITTEEFIRIPTNAMALISIKAGLKFRGLINASGFHVDPGFRGVLVFSVFNAGPQPIHLKRGMDAFLIWFAELTDNTHAAESKKNRLDNAHKNGKTSIDPDIITRIPGEIHSFDGLNAKIKLAEKTLSDRIHTIEKDQAIIKWAAIALFGAALGAVVRSIWR